MQQLIYKRFMEVIRYMYSSETYEVIKKRTLENIYLDIDKREGSIINEFASANALSLARAYIDMGDIISLGFIEDTFDTFLDKRVSEFGVYRKQGTKAVGEVKITVESEVTINNGTILTSGDLSFVVLNDITTSSIDTLYVEALQIGTRYNLLAGTRFTMKNPPSGITELINESSFTGGLDLETDSELRDRFNKVVTNPSTSGNKAHYEEWALEVIGVSKATVYPLFDGPGTVKVVVVGSDGLPVNESVLEATQDYIDEVKPIGPKVVVATPEILQINISANIELNPMFLLEDIISNVEEELAGYLKSVESEVVYNKIVGIIAKESGVVDFEGLVVNGGTSNIPIETDVIPVAGEVELIEVVSC